LARRTVDLAEIRAAIDSIDTEVVEALARRFELLQVVAANKVESGLPMMQSDRVAQVKSRCARLGSELGLSPDFVERLYTLIIDESCEVELRLMDARAGDQGSG